MIHLCIRPSTTEADRGHRFGTIDEPQLRGRPASSRWARVTRRPFAYRNNWPGSLWRSERSANNPDTKAIDRVSAIVTDNNHPGKTV